MDAETQHPIWRKVRELFSEGGWEAEACTPPGVLLRYLWGLYSMSRLICMIFFADLIAYRLNFSRVLWHVDRNSEAVEWIPGVAAVNGGCCSYQDGVRVLRDEC
jgi:hypothetical protein